jgi:DNA helicase-2/ATP-dependent DNA helicase PcrA
MRQVDLTAERDQVRESAKRNAFTGKTYNSIENISQFFAERGVQFPAKPPAPRQPVANRSLPPAPPVPKKPARTGMTVEHPKYGTGTVVRREGEGDDAKITVSFARYGLKKLVEKYAGLKKT